MASRLPSRPASSGPKFRADRGHQRVRRQGAGVAAEDAVEGVHEHALAVGAVAVEVEQHLFAGAAGERVAGDAGQEGGEIRVTVGHPRRGKACQSGASAPGSAGATAVIGGHPVDRVVRPEIAGGQVDDSGGGVQGPGIRIPDRAALGKAGMAARQAFDGADGGSGADGEAAVEDIQFFPAEPLDEEGTHPGPVDSPAAVPPDEPGAPVVDVAQLMAVPLDERLDQGVVGGGTAQDLLCSK